MDKKFYKCDHLVYRKSKSDSSCPPEYDRDKYFDRMEDNEKVDQLEYLHNNLSNDYVHICITSPPPIGRSSHYVFYIKQ